MTEISRIPCRLCGAPTVAHIADGFCVDCIEGDGVIYRDGDWVATPGARARRTVRLLGVLLVELVMMFPRMVRDDWRAHRDAVAARQAREQALTARFGDGV